jgi:hypothetical protein
VSACCSKVCSIAVKSYIEKFGHILVIVPFFLLVRNIDRNQVGVLLPSAWRDSILLSSMRYLVISHVTQLLLIRRVRLGLAMVE